MVNKKLLYETLKKEMEVIQESKAIQRKLQATDPEPLKKQATKEEEKVKRKTLAEL